jgi:uncharacterized protein DUF1176
LIRVLVVVGAAAVLCPAAVWAGPLPGLNTPADRAAWRSLLHWPASCERRWRQSHPPPMAGVDDTWRTRNGARLVTVTCFLGAYQVAQLVYFLPASGKARGPLRFRIYEDPGNGVPKPRTEALLVGELTFDPTKGRLFLFEKARGLGDCGIYSVFHLQGTAFVPVETRAKTACNGKPPLEPTRWPKLPTLR